MIYLVSKNVFLSGLKTAHYEMILCILHIRSMEVHNLPLKLEMMSGESFIKHCFLLTRATFLVLFYLNPTLHTTKRKSLCGLCHTEYSYLNKLLLITVGEGLISHIKNRDKWSFQFILVCFLKA